MTELVHEAIRSSADHYGKRAALRYRGQAISYQELDAIVNRVAGGFRALGLRRHDRVGIYLPKQHETVAAIFGASRAGGVFVPINPSLRPKQVAYILADCNIRFLVTGPDRLQSLLPAISLCPDLAVAITVSGEFSPVAGLATMSWEDLITRGGDGRDPAITSIDSDMAAILYTSGSTGSPKGVVLTHRNMVVGAESVSRYLGNVADDRILAALPLSFDYGLSQLTTAFCIASSIRRCMASRH